ncbi:MAG: OmpA family protein, partial [Algoriphagus sp.]
LIQNDGTLLTDSPNFDRALNFQTDAYDVGLSFVFKPDNNWLLSGKSFFAPYFTLGVGAVTYKVFGDLLDANGNQYNYSNVNLIPDGTFETELTNLGTERTDDYNTTAFYANLGLGVRFRITKTLEIFAQSDFKRTNTDYLDDVSGEYRNSYDNAFQRYAAKPGTNIVTAEDPYRGMENGRPDWYIYHGVGIKFSLGANKKSFNPPVITQRYTYVPTELSQAQMAKKDTINRKQVPLAPTTTNYFTVIQLPANGVSQVTDKNKPTLDSASRANITTMLDSLKASQSDISNEIAATEADLAAVNQTIALAEQDTSVSSEITQVRLQNLEGEKSIAQGKLTSLNVASLETRFKIDSLNSYTSDSVTTTSTPVDAMGTMNELIIYPGQVSRILYSTSPAVLSLDPATQSFTAAAQAAPVAKDTVETFTREQFDEEISKFRQDMLAAQATRDSAMMMAFASKTPASVSAEKDAEEDEVDTQQIILSPESTKEEKKAAKKLEKNRKKQEELNEKNNELLKDALLVGGTAATTAAISNSGDKKRAAANAANDSTLRARIAMDSILIDSLSNIPRMVDTVTVTEVQEKTIQTLLHESKIVVYFGINESTLTEEQRQKLIPAVEFLQKNPEVSIELVGFADNTGSVAYNIALTEKRVAAVTQALTDEFKIAPDRISVSNGGLIVRGRSKGSVEEDRKVELRVIKK